jgi:hypothetical protein
MTKLQERIYDQIMEADKFHNLSATEEQAIISNLEKIVLDFGGRVFASCEWRGSNELPTKEDYQAYLEFIRNTLKDEFHESSM